MGYGSAIIVVSIIVISGVLLLSMSNATDVADAELNEYHNMEIARNTATTGLQATVRKLAEDEGPGTWTSGADYAFPTTDFRTGTFRTEVVPQDPVLGITCPGCSGDTVDVTARGFSGFTRDPQTGAPTPVHLVIFARYVREYADGGVPPAFRNVITTDLYIQLRGNVQIRSIRPDLNASIHTNGDLQTNGNSFLVEGYGTYTGNEFTNQEDNFIPNVDYNGDDPNVFWADSVKIPVINMQALRTLAQTSGVTITDPEGSGTPFIIDGDVLPTPNVIDFTNPGSWSWIDSEEYAYACTVPGGCGTADHPFIMVVERPLNLTNRVEFRGYGVIVSPENIYIDPLGSGGGVFGELNENKETKMMLATQGNIDIAGNACLGLGPRNGNENQHCRSADDTFTHGMTLYAQAMVPPEIGVSFQGSPYLVGGIVAPETQFAGGGTPTIYYASPAEDITDPGFEFVVPIGPVLIAYSEWNRHQ